MTTLISIISLLVSLITLAILLIQYYKDKPQLELSYDVMASDDFSNQWIRIYIVNIGRRPVLLKSAGYYDWAYGHNTGNGENTKIDKLLNETEIHFIDHKINPKDVWRVGKLYVTDHLDNTWYINNDKMFMIYDLGHYNGIPNKTIRRKLPKSKENLYKEYCNTIISNGRKPIKYKDFC